ncbi:hypothetical protein [Terracoccus sp. 273MFTsu3.1]|uniref:hypothetical protein n=1 Tax=Terracoccus sp. 273MFTsu3.1 TaxID=1172188 RepID=UPI00036D1DC0|nr:hypothetical protein [Terracoccus sp. 273MFTsu3.1]
MSDFEPGVAQPTTTDRADAYKELILRHFGPKHGTWRISMGTLLPELLKAVDVERAEALEDFAAGENTGDYGYGDQGSGWYERSAESVLDAARSMADTIREGKK